MKLTKKRKENYYSKYKSIYSLITYTIHNYGYIIITKMKKKKKERKKKKESYTRTKYKPSSVLIFEFHRGSVILTRYLER